MLVPESQIVDSSAVLHGEVNGGGRVQLRERGDPGRGEIWNQLQLAAQVIGHDQQLVQDFEPDVNLGPSNL